MIATIVTTTRMTQPECAIESRNAIQIFGCAFQTRGCKDVKKGSGANLSTNKNARLVTVVRNIREHFFRIFNKQKFNV